MARPRGQSFGESLKIPHSVSLKVLRLTRPSLQSQHAFPHTTPTAANDDLIISPKASLAYPLAEEKRAFILTPILQLPESFQSAYVGEVFSATLCANNELSEEDAQVKSVSNVKVAAEILTPSSANVGVGLDLDDAEDAHGGDRKAGDGEGDESARVEGQGREQALGATMQKVLKLNLKEEGNHTLAVTVTYTEAPKHAPEGTASGGEQAALAIPKVRTFRKLYQFVAVPLLGVRTKAGEVPNRKDGWRRYAVEAQLENLGERAVVLEAISMSPKAPFTTRSLNWDVYGTAADPIHAPVLNPRAVLQLAFLLEEQEKPHLQDPMPEDKIVLGQLNIQWTSAMGDRGSLSTGWLVAKR